MNMPTKLSADDFLKYVKETKSKSTWKEYAHGIRKFSEWFGKSPDEILAVRASDWKSDDLHVKRKFGREIEKFHKWLIENGYTINSARTLTLGIIQLFRFYEMPVTYLSPEVSKTVPTTKTFVPTVEQLRAMFKCADSTRDKLIISMAKDLGWRIGDFVQIKKSDLPNIDADTPLSYDLISEKEKVIAKSFLSAETVALLREYMVTTENNPNPFLFASNHDGHTDPDTINKMLKDVAQRANVRVPANKRLSFHAFRKRFLTECANLNIDVNTAKILVGKDVEDSMLAYLSEVDHRAAFIKLHERMLLTDRPTLTDKESATEIGSLRNEVSALRRMIGAITMLDPSIAEKARALVATQLQKFGSKIVKLEKPIEQLSAIEALELLAQLVTEPKKELSDEERREYERMLRENGNGN